MMDEDNQDICRVCRCVGSYDRQLFHPCICTGSIKFIHQDCLLQWLRYSKKEYCELCKHRFSFAPIYSPDMPTRLPIRDLCSGLTRSMGVAVRCWLHYTLVAVAWLGVVPLTAFRIYRSLFTGSVSSLFTLPIDLLSTENLPLDIFHGSLVVLCTLSAFISLFWLREQILLGGGPDWLNVGQAAPDAPVVPPPHEGEEAPPDPVPAHPPAPNNNNNALAEPAEEHWNPMEWGERGPGEELSWERLLGLDGSLIFLEHVFWVVSLNTLFILVFGFCPYHIGHFALVAAGAKQWVAASHFDGILTGLCGYLVLGAGLVLLHALASRTVFSRMRTVLGICYVVVKVALLSVVEIGVFPLLGGWWLDVCSLGLFDSTFKEREATFRAAPGTSMFLHWLVGMLYVFYFASFILLLREVLRPGVLWFLRNLNDPEFNPVQEMIHLSILRHTRRFLASVVIFGFTVLVLVWVPVRTVQTLLPGFLPYYLSLNSSSFSSELTLELLLLQVVLPAILEQSQTRAWMKGVVRHWCATVSHLLGIRSYLLGDVPIDEHHEGILVGADGPIDDPDFEADNFDQQLPDQPHFIVNDGNNNIHVNNEPLAANNENNNNNLNDLVNNNVEEDIQLAFFEDEAPNEADLDNMEGAPPVVEEAAEAVEELPDAEMDELVDDFLGGGLGAAHQAMLQREGPIGFRPYLQPPYFAVRLLAVVCLMCVSLAFFSACVITLPVGLGRAAMFAVFGSEYGRMHELYTCAFGVYGWVQIAKLVAVLVSWYRLGRAHVLAKLTAMAVLAGKLVLCVCVAALTPLLLGLLLEQVVMLPLRVPLHQTPCVSLWEDWVLGIVSMKILCACLMMGPTWWLKTNLERIYLTGLRNLEPSFVLRDTALPVITCLLTALCIPYVTARSIAPLFFSGDALVLVQRRAFPYMSCVAFFTALGWMQFNQLQRLYERIKNDKYLVGRQLVNYYHRPAPPPTPAATDSQLVTANATQDAVAEPPLNPAANEDAGILHISGRESPFDPPLEDCVALTLDATSDKLASIYASSSGTVSACSSVENLSLDNCSPARTPPPSPNFAFGFGSVSVADSRSVSPYDMIKSPLASGADLSPGVSGSPYTSTSPSKSTPDTASGSFSGTPFELGFTSGSQEKDLESFSGFSSGSEEIDLGSFSSSPFDPTKLSPSTTSASLRHRNPTGQRDADSAEEELFLEAIN